MIREKFDIIVYGDMKNNPNYKAANVVQYIEALNKMGLMGNIICRDSDDYKNSIAIPFGSLIPKFLTFLQVKLGINTRNFSQNILFDFFASRKIKSKYIISTVQGLKKCLKKTHDRGGIYIELSPTEYLAMFLNKLEEESSKFYLSFQKSKRPIFINGVETSKKADYIIGNSNHVQETYLKNGFDSSRVFYCPSVVRIKNKLEINNKDILPHKKEIVFLYVAHTQILKGLQYLIEAWRSLSYGSSARLKIVGNMDKNLKKIFKDYKKESNIDFIGPVSNPQMYYEEADVFVLPTLSEGASNVILEAMSFGLPIISTTECGIEYEDGRDGFIIAPGSIEILRDKIDYFHKNRNAISKMGENAKRTLEKRYNNNAIIIKTEEVLHKIIESETT